MSETGSLGISEILSRVTENPQAMSMLSSLLGGVASSHSESSPSGQEKERESVGVAPVLTRAQSTHRDGKAEERRRLLLALKPFLSKEREQALETLITVLDAISLLPRGKEPPCT